MKWHKSFTAVGYSHSSELLVPQTTDWKRGQWSMEQSRSLLVNSCSPWNRVTVSKLTVVSGLRSMPAMNHDWELFRRPSVSSLFQGLEWTQLSRSGEETIPGTIQTNIPRDSFQDLGVFSVCFVTVPQSAVATFLTFHPIIWLSHTLHASALLLFSSSAIFFYYSCCLLTLSVWL